jgi:hypothetical protein
LASLMDCSDFPTPLPTTRSAVSNGNTLFVVDTIDGRTKEARRFRDVLAQIMDDLGGADRLSEGQKQLARRAALMSLECEKLEAKAVAGEEIDLEAFGKLSDRIGRAFQRLGLKRASRDVTPSLAEYLASKNREASA